jgi:energy-coupling factor transporter ATP-binding protein EcfA2
MIDKIEIKSFKSLFDVNVELGKLNVFIGANGSGKSNFLEAVGVLSAAANGRVHDESLLSRGVRPGVPKLYKSSFQSAPVPQHISLTAYNDRSKYSVALHNPLESPEPDWRYKHELWARISKTGKDKILASQGPKNTGQKKLGLAALKAVEIKESDIAYQMLETLQRYRIFTPTTDVLRGVVRDMQPQAPLGLSGGRLPEAVGELLRLITKDNHFEKITDDFFPLISWASQFAVVSSATLSLSPSASVSPQVICFKDKFMAEGRNELSGYDVSEGALYVLFLTALIALPDSPMFCAIDNADHGLNPLLAKNLFHYLSQWVIEHEDTKQLLVTIHNPLVLDGLLLNDDRIRLFSVNRTASGKTEIKRIGITKELLAITKEKDLTLSRLWTMGYLGGTYNV